MTWWLIEQNNSGGGLEYVPALGVSEYVWIEAETKGQAWERWESIYDSMPEDAYKGYCECCGFRWADGIRGPFDKHPADVGDPLGMHSETVPGYAHHADGRITPIPTRPRSLQC